MLFDVSFVFSLLCGFYINMYMYNLFLLLYLTKEARIHISEA